MTGPVSFSEFPVSRLRAAVGVQQRVLESLLAGWVALAGLDSPAGSPVCVALVELLDGHRELTDRVRELYESDVLVSGLSALAADRSVTAEGVAVLQP